MSALNIVVVAGCLLATGAQAQTYRRQASIVGGGDRDRGRCTVEIMVDGAAEVAFRGNEATVTNLKGQTPELRRFECTSPMPPNPAELRFNGISGRGRQQMVGGAAPVVRVEDPDNGSGRYVFELSWRNGFGRDKRFTTEQAVDTCRQAIRRQVADRFRTDDINFRDTRLDDAPGRQDWVIGTLEARHRGGPPEILKFSCSVNFETGQVRSAEAVPVARPEMNPQAAQNCRRAVEERMRGDGFRRIAFGDMGVDDQPGRRDWIVGDVNGEGPRGPQSLRFSCSVDLRSGVVRSVDVNSRR
jgi:hypothetical protein